MFDSLLKLSFAELIQRPLSIIPYSSNPLPSIHNIFKQNKAIKNITKVYLHVILHRLHNNFQVLQRVNNGQWVYTYKLFHVSLSLARFGLQQGQIRHGKHILAFLLHLPSVKIKNGIVDDIRHRGELNEPKSAGPWSIQAQNSTLWNHKNHISNSSLIDRNQNI